MKTSFPGCCAAYFRWPSSAFRSGNLTSDSPEKKENICLFRHQSKIPVLHKLCWLDFFLLRGILNHTTKRESSVETWRKQLKSDNSDRIKTLRLPCICSLRKSCWKSFVRYLPTMTVYFRQSVHWWRISLKGIENTHYFAFISLSAAGTKMGRPLNDA